MEDPRKAGENTEGRTGMRGKPTSYPHLLSPIKVGGAVFRNRLTASRSSPRFSQSSQPHPTEAVIAHYANKAKHGAALVTCGGVGMPHVISEDRAPLFSSERMVSRIPGSYDIDDVDCRRGLSDLTEAIHFYGAKASMQIGGYVPVKYDVSDGIPCESPFEDSSHRVGEEIPGGLLEEVAEDFARQAAVMKQVGFDMVFLHMAYRLTILGRFLSPLTNKRTDRYGGSVENRARFPLMVADRIKEKCGKDFLIEACISGSEPPGGLTLEGAVELAKKFAGSIDMLQLRTSAIDLAHPTGFNPERTPFLYMAEAVKKSGAEIAVATVGGYLDLDLSEEIIASGKADFVAMARGWISNPEYGRLAYEGRGEDVVPCIRCNHCFRSSNADPLVSVCSVNPTWGLEHKIERMIHPPSGKKKIAVVGGGPAGMEAALIASGRGHEVALYEKSPALGGLLKTTDNVSFKWPLREYKNYLIRQIGRAKVLVLLNTEATADMVRKERYDAVLVAVGASPVIPTIPGVDGRNVVFAEDVYGREDALPEEVAIIGGGEVGIETGMHLAEKGRKVTLLEMGDRLAPHAPPAHFYNMFRDAWERQPGLECIANARCTSIGAKGITYADAEGAERRIEADAVVIAAGMKPKNDLALNFYGAADRFFMIGDCNVAGNVQKAIRSAFGIASML
jgi:2,4-dienoyl-CoA reductase-like NADH-dependent reductase (Old Yellow Enzyme family)/thioredoxin reductase